MSAPEKGRALVSFSLCFQPLAAQINGLRGVLSELCAPYLDDPDELSRLLLAAHELLENIVKYSTGSFAEFHFLLEPDEHCLRARLRTKNRAHPDRLADAQQRLDALAAASDKVAHYDELIRASAKHREGSGLGLARIPAETEMQLCYSTEQDWLILTAESIAFAGGSR